MNTDKWFVDALVNTPLPDREGDVEVRPSPIHGRGLFALRDFEPGEWITFYPPHIVVHTQGKRRIVKEHCSLHPTELPVPDLVRQNLAYEIPVYENVSIVGLPELDQHSGRLGHLANDGACGWTIADRVHYDHLSARRNNAVFQDEGINVALVSTKSIARGEEILVTYGRSRWVNIA